MARKQAKTVYLIANGDLRLSANQECEAAQRAMESKLIAAIRAQGWSVQRAHGYDPVEKHSFIHSQKMGMEVFKKIPVDAPLVVAEAVWEYSHHVLPGLYTHTGPILVVANWSGQWPGLVGMLNLCACLAKANIPYSSLWSEDFTDEFFLRGLRSWLAKGLVKHDLSHVHPLKEYNIPARAKAAAKAVASDLLKNKAIMGCFDEGCMGMFNAIIPEELLHPLGIFKERLSQSALYARMLTVFDQEARQVYNWLVKKGMRFQFGKNEKTDLTLKQVLGQCKMYVAAVRIADEFGCSVIGIQYQQGLKDLCPASDLVEGLLNNVDRPPVRHETTGKVLFSGEAVPHFNEVDESAGVDGLITYRIWRKLGLSPENTLHDVRWGRTYWMDGKDEFVWLFLISGAVPPVHFPRGYRDAVGMRQPAMFFPQGGSTIRGVSKPGPIVWSRVFVQNNRVKMDIGLAECVQLPDHEVAERWRLTTPQWPMMNAVLKGISRDQFMARHKSNHIQVAYAPTMEKARLALLAKAGAMRELGAEVFVCGTGLSES